MDWTVNSIAVREFIVCIAHSDIISFTPFSFRANKIHPLSFSLVENPLMCVVCIQFSWIHECLEVCYDIQHAQRVRPKKKKKFIEIEPLFSFTSSPIFFFIEHKQQAIRSPWLRNIGVAVCWLPKHTHTHTNKYIRKTKKKIIPLAMISTRSYVVTPLHAFRQNVFVVILRS